MQQFYATTCKQKKPSFIIQLECNNLVTHRFCTCTNLLGVSWLSCIQCGKYTFNYALINIVAVLNRQWTTYWNSVLDSYTMLCTILTKFQYLKTRGCAKQTSQVGQTIWGNKKKGPYVYLVLYVSKFEAKLTLISHFPD